MLNIYTFHGALTCKKDKRIRKKVKHSVGAFSVNQAFGMAEKFFDLEHPDETISLTLAGA